MKKIKTEIAIGILVAIVIFFFYSILGGILIGTFVYYHYQLEKERNRFFKIIEDLSNRLSDKTALQRKIDNLQRLQDIEERKLWIEKVIELKLKLLKK